MLKIWSKLCWSWRNL